MKTGFLNKKNYWLFPKVGDTFNCPICKAPAHTIGPDIDDGGLIGGVCGCDECGETFTNIWIRVDHDRNKPEIYFLGGKKHYDYYAGILREYYENNFCT